MHNDRTVFGVNTKIGVGGAAASKISTNKSKQKTFTKIYLYKIKRNGNKQICAKTF